MEKSKKEDIACRLRQNEVTTQTFERRQQTISGKIVQLNEEVIRGQIKGLASAAAWRKPSSRCTWQVFPDAKYQRCTLPSPSPGEQKVIDDPISI